MTDIKPSCQYVLSEMQRRRFSKSSLYVAKLRVSKLASWWKLNEASHTDVHSAFAAFYDHCLVGELPLLSVKRRTKDLCVFRRIEQHAAGQAVRWENVIPPMTAVNERHEWILSTMASDPRWSSDAVRKNVLSASRMFFAWLERHGCADVSRSSESSVREYYIDKSMRIKCVKSIRYALKNGMRWLKRHGYVDFECEALFALGIRTRQRLLPAADNANTARILDSIDRSTSLGRRDYAMILLGAALGLRPVDIVNMRLSDIDWRKGEIGIVQRKTGVALRLPLLQGVGEALKDYILHGRPDTECQQVFVSHHTPFSGLIRSAPGKRFVVLAQEVGLGRGDATGLTFYALRRALGRNLVAGGVPIPTVAQMLGHTELRSAESYMSFDGGSLSECALSFGDVEEDGE